MPLEMADDYTALNAAEMDRKISQSLQQFNLKFKSTAAYDSKDMINMWMVLQAVSSNMKPLKSFDTKTFVQLSEQERMELQPLVAEAYERSSFAKLRRLGEAFIFSLIDSTISLASQALLQTRDDMREDDNFINDEDSMSN